MHIVNSRTGYSEPLYRRGRSRGLPSRRQERKIISLMTSRITLFKIEKHIDPHGATPHVFRHTFGNYLS